MFHRRLNFHISFNLIVVLALAMLLINFVVMAEVQRLLLKNKAAEGALLAAAVEAYFDGPESAPTERGISVIEHLLETSDYTSALIIGATPGLYIAVGSRGMPEEALASAAKDALTSNRSGTRLTGAAWGVFRREKAILVFSAPVHGQNGFRGAISAACHLHPLYGQLRRIQQHVFIYLLVNLILLTLLGRYRLSRLIIQPLKKLVETAESYKDGGKALFFGGEKDGDEFNQLSCALNQMLHRISRDQEDLRRSVHSLEKANVDLKRAQNDIINAEKLASVGRLSAGIAHEIGNPLAIIIGYLELLKRNDISTAEQKDFISRTESEIHRINQIIRQLLDVSRPSNNDIGRISIHEVLSDIAAVFKYQPLMKDMRLVLALEASDDHVVADAALLRQAFLNLVINAADALAQVERPGVLTIKTCNPAPGPPPEARKTLEISFADNGVGIPEAQIPYLFEPFFTTKAPGKGTGLGLSVCYMIVKASGGSIQVHSREGDGTRMVIELPIRNGGKTSNAGCK